MHTKYKDFLKESLILESEVVFSKNFKKVLSEIDHPISDKLKDVENKDLDTRNNFFDVSLDDNSKISFMPDSKGQKIMNYEEKYYRFNGNDGGWLKNKPVNQHLFDKLGYSYEEGESPYNPNSSELGKEVSSVVSEKSGNTYIYLKFKNGEGVYNLNKLSKQDPEKIIWNKSRQEIKAGKGVKAILKSNGINIDPKKLEEFVNLFKSSIDKLDDKFRFFSLVKEDEIAYWYDDANYYDRSQGKLGGSCMSDVDSDFFEIYTTNEDVCQMVIYKSPDDEDLILGRALLWTLTNGKKFMDRIYTNYDSDVDLFKEYAKKNGWYTKQKNTYNNYNNYLVSPNGELSDDALSTREGSISVKIKQIYYDQYPYMDTLKYYDEYNTLSSYERSGDIELEGTDGEPSNRVCEFCDGNEMVECAECSGSGTVDCGECSFGMVDCDECDYNGNVDCDECWGQGEQDCEECDGDGEIDGEDCKDCDGTGKSKCVICDGDGEVDCIDCDGTNEVTCDECNGDEEVECGECWGNGEVDCPECQY